MTHVGFFPSVSFASISSSQCFTAFTPFLVFITSSRDKQHFPDGNANHSNISHLKSGEGSLLAKDCPYLVSCNPYGTFVRWETEARRAKWFAGADRVCKWGWALHWHQPQPEHCQAVSVPVASPCYDVISPQLLEQPPCELLLPVRTANSLCLFAHSPWALWCALNNRLPRVSSYTERHTSIALVECTIGYNPYIFSTRMFKLFVQVTVNTGNIERNTAYQKNAKICSRTHTEHTRRMKCTLDFQDRTKEEYKISQ